MHTTNKPSGTRMRRGFLAAALVAIGLLGPAGAQAAGCSLKYMDLPVRMVGSRAIATLDINGSPVSLVVDSGAFFSMLTPSAAAQLKLSLHPLPRGLVITGLAGRAEAQLATVDRLQLGKGSIPDVDFIVGGNEDVPGTMGLLGRNILSFADTEYDLAHGIIRLVIPSEACEQSNMAYWAADMPVAELPLLHAFRDRSPPIRARVKINDQTVTALFDTGATTLLSLRAAHRAGVKDADLVANGRHYGIGTDSVKSWTTRIAKVDFGGEAIMNNQLVVDDYDLSDNDMLVGVDFFLSHRVYVSKQQSKMYFTYGGGPVFARNKGTLADTAAADEAASGAAPLTADALARRGEASLSRGNLPSALADLDRACAMEPADANHRWARARVHLAMKDIAAARVDLDKALELDPWLAEARITRAGLREGAHEREGALEDLALLDTTLPPPSDIRRGMALLFSDMHMPAQAIAQWNLWLPVHEHDIGRQAALNGRCWSRVELGIELDKALDDCDEAVSLDGKNASFVDSRAWTYLRMGKLKKALSDFDRALELDPKSAWSLYGRGQVQLALGQPDKAWADLAAARRERPGIDADARRDGLPQAPAAPRAAAAAASS
jgi:tetratricopeptide (TPR) repeat protein/predicted aspartyl protease